MRFSQSWLRRHWDGKASACTIAQRLTAIGHEVESWHDPSLSLADLKVGVIVSVKEHPNADRLRLCQVDSGDDILDIVCGAPNVRPDMRTALAVVGTKVGSITIKKAKIRGQVSHGMLCSAAEIGLDDSFSQINDGILDLEVGQAGQSLAQTLGLDDPVFTLSITPNRGDCTGVYGIARDLAASGLGRLKPLSEAIIRPDFDCQISITATPDQQFCRHYAGRVIRNVRNQPSPPWLCKLLHAAGCTPISALIDITNYLNLDRSRPLHVFDLPSVGSGIRLMEVGQETPFAGLDGKEYLLNKGCGVIASHEGSPLAIAGVIGGRDSGCRDDSVDIFLESACFDPLSVAQTGRSLNVLTDARYCFERGIDADETITGLEAATSLILEICGGQASSIIQWGESPPPLPPVKMRWQRLGAVTGVDIHPKKAASILQDLGFKATYKAVDGDTWQPPSWRHDIHMEEDMIEEVLRLTGYDKIPSVLMPALGQAPTLAMAAWPKPRRLGALLSRRLIADGFDETISWSMISAAQAQAFGTGTPHLTHPISQDMVALRPSIVPSLLIAAGQQYRTTQRLALFEEGPIWLASGRQRSNDPSDVHTAFGQRQALSALVIGKQGVDDWRVDVRDADFFTIKIVMQGLLDCLADHGYPTSILLNSDETPDWLHPKRAARIIHPGSEETVAVFGAVHPRIIADYSIKAEVFALEMMLDPWPDRAVRPKPLERSTFPEASRDLAFILPSDMAVGPFIDSLGQVAGPLVRSVRLFDRYQGLELGAGKQSIGLRVIVGDDERTLTQDDIDQTIEALVEQARTLGAALRS